MRRLGFNQIRDNGISKGLCREFVMVLACDSPLEVDSAARRLAVPGLLLEAARRGKDVRPEHCCARALRGADRSVADPSEIALARLVGQVLARGVVALLGPGASRGLPGCCGEVRTAATH